MKIRALRKTLKLVIGLGIGISIGVVVTQDLQIFPGAFKMGPRIRDIREIKGDRISSAYVKTRDGESIHVVRLKPPTGKKERGQVALVFHGNGGDLFKFFDYQIWLSDMGYTAYGFDYRGFGRSTGWPSERGIYLDSEAVWDYIKDKEGVEPSDVIVLGVSLGTAPAARLAARYGVCALILIAPYASLPQLVGDMSFYWLFKPFLWYEFPTAKFVQQLKHTSLFVAHGKKDKVVPFKHGKSVYRIYNGAGNSLFLADDSAGHNDIFYKVRNKLAEKLNSLSCSKKMKDN